MNPGFGLPWWLWAFVFALLFGLIFLAAHRSEASRKRRLRAIDPDAVPAHPVMLKSDGRVEALPAPEKPFPVWLTIRR